MRWVAIIASAILVVGIVGLLYWVQQTRTQNPLLIKPHSAQVR